MSAENTIVTHCPSCNEAMDITATPPFARVSCPSCGEKSRVKREFGPYHLERRLSTGGMSVLFVARDTLLDREVALKILNEDYSADERRISAFEEEARVTASLSHPNIVRVLTTGRAFGRFFIAMELVPGGHFEHHIRTEGKIPEPRMLMLAIQIANGLKAAHKANLIHRDIKPGNILLDADGNAKIVDFGLALVTQGGTARANEFWATPYYVPPETIEGADEDFRSDIYAFGATLYHALAGKPPCDEASMATDVLRAAKKNVIPLHLAEPGLSMAVCKIVDKAMAYEPDRRHASYDELLHELQAAANHTKHGIKRESAGQAASRRSRSRHSKRVAVASAGLLAGIAVISGLAWMLGRGKEDRPAPPPTTQADRTSNAAPAADNTADLGRLYEDARDALIQRHFGTAHDRFARLHANPNVLEPTRTWAGIQAIVAALLDEDGDRARLLSGGVRIHVSHADSGDPEIAATLLPLLARIETDGPVVFQDDDPPRSGAAALFSWLIVGIHEWQFGSHTRAASRFEAALGVELDDDAGWAVIYQDIARNHLSDLALLDDPAFRNDPADLDAAEKAFARIESLRGEVRTRGPISEILRQRLNEINRSRRRFEREALMENDAWESEPPYQEEREADLPPAPPPPDDLSPAPDPPAEDRPDRARVIELLANYEFRDARRTIRQLDEEVIETHQRIAWMTLTRGAETFMESLHQDVATDAIPISTLMLKSGETATGIRSHPTGVPADENDRPISWSDIHPDSYIEWHRARIPRLDEAERVQAHETAIAFDLLAGDRVRAVVAIERLSKTDANFERYWQLILDRVPK